MFAATTSSFGQTVPFTPPTHNGTGMQGIVVAASLLLVGTGASYPVDGYKQWRQYIQPRVQFAIDTTDVVQFSLSVPDVDVRNVAQHLANIREVLSPSMSELAKELGKTRQALYKWLSGENQPDDATTHFITTLSNIADAFFRAGIEDAKMLVKMKAFDGLSLMDLIQKGEDWHQPVQVLIDEANAMSAAVKKANFGESKATPTDGWKASISIPGTVEG